MRSASNFRLLYLLLVLLNLVDQFFFALPFSTEVMFLVLSVRQFPCPVAESSAGRSHA